MNYTLTQNLSRESSVLKNTFMLLAAMFAFSALAAGAAMAAGLAIMNPWLMLGVYIAILIGLHFNANSGLGVVLSFALTGWLGFTAGPIVAMYLSAKPGVVLAAFTMASVMLLGLSAYAAISKQNFGFMGGFLTIGLLVAFVASLIALFFQITVLSLIVSGVFVVLSGGVILYQVSEIVHGGETNYVLAAVTLFVSFFNIFTSLLNLLGFNTD
jgi:modulator of FtsH protease